MTRRAVRSGAWRLRSRSGVAGAALLLVGASLGCAPAALPSAPPPAVPPAPAAATAEAVHERTLAAGVRHRYLRDARGPWAVHVLELDLAACGVELRSVKADDRLVGRATTSAMAAAAERRWQRPALAAVNADFFRFDPPGVPIGAQVSDGEAVHGPTKRPVFGLTSADSAFIAIVRLEGGLRAAGGAMAPLSRVNGGGAEHGLGLFNRFIGDRSPGEPRGVAARLRPLDATGAAGDTVHAVVLQLDTVAVGFPFAADEVVVAGQGDRADFLRRELAVGDTVAWWLAWPPAPGPVRELVGGFPRLLAGGEPVHHLDGEVRPAFGDERHPRTAVGWRPDGTLLLVGVDGRQPGYSEGMSLAELAALFLELGATDALNLDGGGSTTVVVDGAVANRPSDAGGERAAANALVVLGPAPSEPHGCDH